MGRDQESLNDMPAASGGSSPPGNDIREAVRELLSSQRLGVLATNADGQPYTNLVAVAATPDLSHLLLATTRATRKFSNLSADPRVSFTVDNCSNAPVDFQKAAAVTALGQAREVPSEERQEFLDIYLDKHPSLESFVRSPSCALLKVEVEVYYLVRRFQEVMEWHLKP